MKGIVKSFLKASEDTSGRRVDCLRPQFRIAAGRARDEPALAAIRAAGILLDELACSLRLHRRAVTRGGSDPERTRQALVAEAAGVMRHQKRRDSLFGDHPDPSRRGRTRQEKKASVYRRSSRVPFHKPCGPMAPRRSSPGKSPGGFVGESPHRESREIPLRTAGFARLFFAYVAVA